MMKKLITLVFIFLAAWSAGYIWSKYRYTVSDNSKTVKKLVDCDAEKIQRIQFTRKKAGTAPEVLAFERVTGVDSAWKIAEPNLGEADASVMDHIAAMFCESFNPERAKVQEIDLRLEQESTDIVLLQKASANGREESAKTFAFTIPADTTGREAFLLLNKKIFKILPVIKQAVTFPVEKYQNHRVMSMSGDNIIDLCVYDDAVERYCFTREGADWSVRKKGKALGTGTEEVNKYVNRVSTLLALHILDFQKPWSECRMKIPPKKNIRIEVTGVAGRKESLVFSQPTAVVGFKKQKFLQTCDSARNSLFAVHTDLLKFLNIAPARLVQKKSAKH